MSIRGNDLCPCDSGKKYKKCCRRWHQGQKPTHPEQVMRARYSAYTLGNADYIMQTTHPDSPHYESDEVVWRLRLNAFMTGNSFDKLDVVETDANKVHFQAYLSDDEHDYLIEEWSIFLKDANGHWTYSHDDGSFVDPNQSLVLAD